MFENQNRSRQICSVRALLNSKLLIITPFSNEMNTFETKNVYSYKNKVHMYTELF